MLTIDRINRLRAAMQGDHHKDKAFRRPITVESFTKKVKDRPYHQSILPDIIAQIERRAGLAPVSAYIGTRLARLELHVLGIGADYMFWLGADGENPDRGRASAPHLIAHSGFRELTLTG